jgi:predicted nucleic acid-binding protein
MIVIADTGPLNYLVLIGSVDVLQPLYTRVIVPPALARLRSTNFRLRPDVERLIRSLAAENQK